MKHVYVVLALLILTVIAVELYSINNRLYNLNDISSVSYELSNLEHTIRYK